MHRPVVMEGDGPVAAAHFMSWMPGPIPWCPWAARGGGLTELEQLFANAVLDPKPRDTSPADLDAVQVMLHQMEPMWLFVRNQNRETQHQEQLSRYEDAIHKLKRTVEARDDTVRRLRLDTKELQNAVDRGGSDEQLASRRHRQSEVGEAGSSGGAGVRQRGSGGRPSTDRTSGPIPGRPGAVLSQLVVPPRSQTSAPGVGRGNDRQSSGGQRTRKAAAATRVQPKATGLLPPPLIHWDLRTEYSLMRPCAFYFQTNNHSGSRLRDRYNMHFMTKHF